MSKPVECDLNMSCLLCDWSIEAKNASPGLSATFVAEAQTHTSQHDQHAVEIVQRVRVYSENYVEPAPPAQDARSAAVSRDPGIQTGFLDRSSRDH